MCWSFFIIYPHRLVRPLLRISTYNWSNFMRDRIITIYHHSFFLPTQWRLFTVTIVDCCVLKFFYDYSSWMIATTCWYHRFHWNYFFEQSDYPYTDIMLTDLILSSFMEIWTTVKVNILVISVHLWYCKSFNSFFVKCWSVEEKLTLSVKPIESLISIKCAI